MFGWGKRTEPDEVSWQDDQASDGDDGVHTPAHPYCRNVLCWCHTDVDYHDQVTGSFADVTEEQVEEAYSFFGVLRK